MLSTSPAFASRRPVIWKREKVNFEHFQILAKLAVRSILHFRSLSSPSKNVGEVASCREKNSLQTGLLKFVGQKGNDWIFWQKPQNSVMLFSIFRIFRSQNMVVEIRLLIYLVQLGFLFPMRRRSRKSIEKWMRKERITTCLLFENREKWRFLEISYLGENTFFWSEVLATEVSQYWLSNGHTQSWIWELTMLCEFSMSWWTLS